MSRIRGSDTKPELALRSALWRLGLRYRLHVPITGKPDIVFPRYRLVVFVDGCFWHGCPVHGVAPKTRSQFWNEKLGKNITRDLRTTAILETEGWTVLRIWEHEIKDDVSRPVERVLAIVRGRPNTKGRASKR